MSRAHHNAAPILVDDDDDETARRAACHVLKRRILLADDDEQLQRAVTRIAEKHGYDVIHVTRGGDVVSRAAETKPELIVLDISFPDADGRDILSALKADARTAEIGVLVWSGAVRDPESDRKISLSLGAEDYVEKTDAQTLLLKIERVLLRLDLARSAPGAPATR